MLTGISGFYRKLLYVGIGLVLLCGYYLTMRLDWKIIDMDLIRVQLEGMIRIFVASVVGSSIGYEREHKHRPAGLRTHSLVCVGAALVMIIPMVLQLYNTPIQMDVTRLGAQVISGIGFLGAGTIIRNGGSVKGLTTAATLWVVAIIGLVIGSGLYIIGIFATLIVHFILRNFRTE